MSVNENI